MKHPLQTFHPSDSLQTKLQSAFEGIHLTTISVLRNKSQFLPRKYNIGGFILSLESYPKAIA